MRKVQTSAVLVGLLVSAHSELRGIESSRLQRRYWNSAAQCAPTARDTQYLRPCPRGSWIPRFVARPRPIDLQVLHLSEPFSS